MKKLTKSMKIVLISVVSAVCVAGIVLGCVLGFRKKDNDVEPTLSFNQKVELFNEEFSNKKNLEKNNYDIVLGTPFENYVTSEKKLVDFYSNYFVIQGEIESEKEFYFYTSNSNSGFEVTKLINFVSQESEYGNYLLGYHDGYIVYETKLSEDGKDISIFRIVKIEDGQLSVICEYKTKESEVIEQNGYLSNNNYFYFNVVNYEYLGETETKVETEEGSETSSYGTYNRDAKLYLFNIITQKLTLVSEYQLGTDEDNIVDIEEVFDNAFLINCNNERKLFVFDGGNVYSYKIVCNEKETFNMVRELTSYSYLIERKIDQEITVDGVVNLRYTTLIYRNGNFKESDFVSKAKIYQIESEKLNDNFYYFKELVYDENDQSYLYNKIYCYYKDGSKLFEDDLDSSTYSILMVCGKNVLTKQKLFTIEENGVHTIVDFYNDNKMVISYNESTNKVAYLDFSTDEYKVVQVDLLDLSKDSKTERFLFVDDEGIEHFVTENNILGTTSIGSEFVLIVGDVWYKYNFETLKFYELENLVLDNVLSNIYSNVEFYFVQENGTYSIKSLTGETIVKNISKYDFEKDIESGLLITLETTDNGVVQWRYNNNYNFASSLNIESEVESTEPYSNSVSPYALSYTDDGTTNTGGTRTPYLYAYFYYLNAGSWHRKTLKVGRGVWFIRYQFETLANPASPGYSWTFKGWASDASNFSSFSGVNVAYNSSGLIGENWSVNIGIWSNSVSNSSVFVNCNNNSNNIYWYFYASYQRDITAYKGVGRGNIIFQKGSCTTAGEITEALSISAEDYEDWVYCGFSLSSSNPQPYYTNPNPGINGGTSVYAVYMKTATATFYSGVSKATSYDRTWTKYETAGYAKTFSTTVDGTLDAESSCADVTSWTKVGWRDDTTAGNKEYDWSSTYSGATLGETYKFYAVYSRTLTVSYNGNGNTGGSAPANTTKVIYLNTNSTTTSSR